VKTRCFVGSTHHEVMRQVRCALGPEALIVSSRRCEAGVEIIAAEEPGVPAAAAPADVVAAIDGLRGMLEHRIDTLAWDTHLKRAPVSGALFQALLVAGFSTELARTLLASLPETLAPDAALTWARNALLTRLPVLPSADALWCAGGVFALVGPTGVGKTTTVAKLAARCALRMGADRVAMVTTDSYRVGAYEQLQIYGRLMQVPVYGARDATELRQTLTQLAGRDLILIDNVGLSQRDRQVAEQAAMLCTAGRQVRRVLVLNAASHGDTLDEVARAYQPVSAGAHGENQTLAGCILSKLDEAPRLGAVLDTAIRYRLPVHYVSQGQRVPEDLAVAEAAALLDRALAPAQRSPALYAPNQADLAALWGTAPRVAQQAAQTVTLSTHRRLLAALTGGVSDASELEQALAYLQHEPVMTLTRTLSAVSMPSATETALADMVQSVCAAFAPCCQSHLLAVHGARPLKWGATPTSRLASAVLLSDRGQAIAAPYQQWLNAQHSLATWSGPAQAGPLTASAALRERVARVCGDYPHLPLVHVLEGGAASLWQQLSQTGINWLSKIGGACRVVLDDGASTAQALARSLVHTVVAPAVLGHDGSTQTWWVGEAPVRACARGATLYRLVSLRVIDKRSGAVTACLYGLSNLAAEQVPSARLASWLMQQHSVKGVFRLMTAAWQALAHQQSITDVRGQALWAGQLGLAAWHVAHAPAAQALRRLLENLAGSRVTATLPGALLRLFAVLDMVEPSRNQ